MKHKKFSTAILCGFKKVDGRQYFKDYCDRRHDDPTRPRAVCVLGARNLCVNGNATNTTGMVPQSMAFFDAWGEYPDELNDDGMPWEHIYGMARAAGL
jgi:hypothetical protein